MLIADFAFALAVIAMLAANLNLSRRLPKRVAMQWGVSGKPTWSAPKRMAMWGPLALAAGVRLLVFLAMTAFPSSVHGPEIGLLISSIVIAGAHTFTLYKAAK